jgi:WbqC-like protein family
MKKVAILQSNYIPWKGYFDMIASIDEFILYDDMQYTRRDWRNRNQIKTPQKGLQWLTVPVQAKGKYHQKIKDTEIDGADWALIHWKALVQNYHRAPYFDKIATWFHLRSEELVSGSPIPSIHIAVLARVDKHE